MRCPHCYDKLEIKESINDGKARLMYVCPLCTYSHLYIDPIVIRKLKIDKITKKIKKNKVKSKNKLWLFLKKYQVG
jgi:protein-arginine kinase activator protein McsA